MKTQSKYITKRNILLALLGVVTVFLTVISYLPKESSSDLTGSADPETVSSTDETFSFLPAPEPQALNNIQIQQLESDGIELENLYPNNPTADLRSDTTIVSTEEYSIHFFAEELLFQFMLYAEPFSDTQIAAEEAFLAQLELTEQQACNLKVRVINQPEDFSQPATTTSKLSFCP